MRKRIYEIVSIAKKGDYVSRTYDILMMIIICLSLVPLIYNDKDFLFGGLEMVCVSIFVVDYFLRWVTADYKYNKGKLSFLIYPFTPMAIIELVSIFPFFVILIDRFRWLKLIRLLRSLIVLRVFRFFTYSKSFKAIVRVFKNSKKSLIAVAVIVISYIIACALVMYNVEPDMFNNFIDAIYWATISLTTVGYGDIYPTTIIGKLINVLSAIFGIVIIALPSGIITGNYLAEINKEE